MNAPIAPLSSTGLRRDEYRAPKPAVSMPAPAALAMPAELKPAATKKPEHSGASPRMYWLSGVKDSGPLTVEAMPACSMLGTRWMCASRCTQKVS